MLEKHWETFIISLFSFTQIGKRMHINLPGETMHIKTNFHLPSRVCTPWSLKAFSFQHIQNIYEFLAN